MKTKLLATLCTCLFAFVTTSSAATDPVSEAMVGDITCTQEGLEDLAVPSVSMTQNANNEWIVEISTPATIIEIECVTPTSGFLATCGALTTSCPGQTFTASWPVSAKTLTYNLANHNAVHFQINNNQALGNTLLGTITNNGVSAGISGTCVIALGQVGVPLVCSFSATAAAASCWTAWWFKGYICGAAGAASAVGVGAIAAGVFDGDAAAVAHGTNDAKPVKGCAFGASGGTCTTGLALAATAAWTAVPGTVCATGGAEGKAFPAPFGVVVPTPAVSTHSSHKCGA